MKNEIKLLKWQESISRSQSRLREAYYWFPYPALISVGLVFVLSGHILPELNPRFGSIANLITLEAEIEKEGSIWLGLYLKNNQIITVTSDRKKFSWAINETDSSHIGDLINYLRNRVKNESISAGLSLESSTTKISAVLAVDQNINFGQLRPIITALAEARISNYGFETRITR